MKTPLVSIVAGPAGGKTTQVKKLENYLFSKNIGVNKISEKDIYGTSNSENLDEQIPSLFQQYLDEQKNSKFILLDGLPNQKHQTSYLLSNFDVKRVYLLDAPDAILMARMYMVENELYKTLSSKHKCLMNFKKKILPAFHEFPSGLTKEISGVLPEYVISSMIKEDLKIYLK